MRRTRRKNTRRRNTRSKKSKYDAPVWRDILVSGNLTWNDLAAPQYPEDGCYARVYWGINTVNPPDPHSISLFGSPEFNKFAQNFALYCIKGVKITYHPVEVMGSAGATYQTDEMYVSSTVRAPG